MGLSVKTRIMLWGRAAGRCSFPECQRDLVFDATETDEPSLIGEFCHIVAESLNGPRGNSPLTLDQRNTYTNLVVMCAVHHKLIDDQEVNYTVARLQAIKTQHESLVRSSLDGKSVGRQRWEETVAGYLDEWATRCGLGDWDAWTSWLLGGNPSMLTNRFDALKEITQWLLSRIWPRDHYPRLRGALDNFRRVVGGFVLTFDRHAERQGKGGPEDVYHFKKFYKIREYNEALYSKLLREYECQVALIDDYVYELTRAII